jgi:alpha-beta hydrolase superfamily lysophospholipase
MINDTFYYSSYDGQELFGRYWLPKEDVAPRAAVQIVHGMAEHSDRYDSLARALVEEGFCVYAGDHRGHGYTAKDVKELGHFADKNGWELVVEDLHKLTAEIKSKHPDIPVFLLGHSMGSLLGRDYISRFGNEVGGAILSATSGDPGLIGSAGRLIAKIEGRLRGKRTPSPLLDKLTFGNYNSAFKPARTPSDWLSRDHLEVDRYINDPLCGAISSTQFFVDLIANVRKVCSTRNINTIPKDLPVYFISGSLDPLGKNTVGVMQVYRTYIAAGIRDVTYTFYEDARHELLKETNRQEVIADIITWLNKHV